MMVQNMTIERGLHGLGLIAIASMFLFITVCQTTQTSVHHVRRENTTTPAPQPAKTTSLVTTLCVDKCQSSCRDYHTPLQQCFSGATLFPSDESWNSTESDILDTPLNATHFRRNIYTANTSCEGDPTDGFELPFQECVGPFGAPRPWGSFRLFSMEEEASIF